MGLDNVGKQRNLKIEVAVRKFKNNLFINSS